MSSTTGNRVPVDKSLRHDLILSGLGILLLVPLLWLVFTGLDPARTAGAGTRPVIGDLARSTNHVRRRLQGMLVWDQIPAGTSIYQQDAIYAGTDSEAVISLKDGSTVVLDENSLAVIQGRVPASDSSRSSGEVTVEVVRGSAAGESRAGELALRAGKTRLSLERNSRARVRVKDNRSARVDVLGGQALVKSRGRAPRKLSAGQRGRIDPQGRVATHDLPVRLLTPADGKRIYYTKTPPAIEFRWRARQAPASDGCLFELGQDAGFRRLVTSRRLSESRLQVAAVTAGSYFWRVRCGDPASADSSQERKLTLIADVSPVLYRPRQGELVYLPGRDPLLFAWSRVPDVERYRIEISRDGRKLVSQEVGKPQYLHAGGLAEGNYCFRTRSADPQRGDSPWSRPTCFRVINRPVPRAPRLFDPRLETVPSGKESGKPPRGSWLWRLVGGVAHAKEKPARAIVLRWEAIPGIRTYILEIGEDREFQSVILRQRVEHNYFRWRTLTHRTYFWRVKSVDAEGREGEFSKPKMIGAVVGGPTPLAPGPGAVLVLDRESIPVRLRWQGSDLLTSYQVQISREAGFEKKALLKAGTQNQVTYQASLTGTHYWRVVGTDLNGRKTRPGKTARFTVRLAPPRPLRPADQARIVWNVERPVVRLGWSRRAARRYQVQLSRHRRFRKARTRTAARASLDHRPGTPGTFYWRVRCLEPESEWSRPRRFTMELMSPAPLSPEEGASIRTPGDQVAVELSWKPVPGASAYLLDIGRPEPERVAGTRVSLDLAPGRYTWTVRALDPAGNPSRPSEARSLEIQASRPPVGIEPPPPAEVDNSARKTGSPKGAPPTPKIPVAVETAAAPAPPVVYLAPHLSFFTNLGAVSTLRYGVEIGARLPFWQRRLAVSLLASYYTASTSTRTEDPGLSASSRVHGIPLDLVLTLRIPTSWLAPYLGTGLQLGLSRAVVSMDTQPEIGQTEVDFGLIALGGAEIALGPGALFLEFRYALSTRRLELVEIDPGGLTVGAGYRIGIW